MTYGPRDLVFVSHIPFEAASGGGIYTRAIFELLSSAWSSGSVSFAGPKTATNPSRVTCFALAMLTAKPSKAIYAARNGLQSTLEYSGIENASVVCLNGPDALPLVERYAPDADLMSVCHNMEAAVLRDQVARLPWPFRHALQGDLHRYAILEDRAFRKSRLIIAISSRDAVNLRKRYPDKVIVHVPPVFRDLPSARAARPPSAPLKLGFIGGMSWWPNRDALDWLCRVLDPMPPNVELHVYGSGSEDWDSPAKGVFAHGFVRDADNIWDNMDVALCPMRVGGGVNIKLVDSLIRGIPVLTTPFGLRGLGLEFADGPGLRIRESAAAWRAFCESDDVRQLASETPPPGLAQIFHSASHALPVARSLTDAGLLP